MYVVMIKWRIYGLFRKLYEEEVYVSYAHHRTQQMIQRKLLL